MASFSRIGDRDRGLELCAHLLGAEFDRRQFGLGGIAGDVVELVPQHISGAHELVLRDQRALALDLEDIGKGRREILELAGEPGEPLAPGRLPRAVQRLIDGVFQAGLGRKRRLGVVFLARHDVIFHQRTIRNQLAVDIAGKISL